MIITKLIGGLGNQMFQYAAGRRISFVNNTELKLDISGYEKQVGITKRQYTLNIFKIREKFATKKEINKLKRGNFLLRCFKKNTYIKEKQFHFDPNVLTAGDNSYLEGYWASEKYFKDIEDIIRKEFILKDKPDTANQKMIGWIKNCDSVSIHIRHGDYVSDEITNKFHGVCNLGYYFRAVDLLARKVKIPYFFVFSDDIQWVKRNFRLKFPSVYVDQNNGKKDYEDFRLMTYCKHNIIANSSFSWWGAWLNTHPKKIVTAPKQWFNNQSINTDDLIPKPWLKI